ncbi:flagellar hook capping FlgD N-terminal domain-containing protein [Shimia biformata]|uniref:flagellar hook capping FlgD N-terminal domain-containing protein n=1 Tax=Shimia biformata TaxID=1294299 RepID=UPI0019529306|nr:flagellar hook capping FlgD N-terminal domain-containing protein [Shimia biformata]
MPQSEASTSDANGNSALASDFETFLKMLTVQMQNQDPLNPMDSSEFAMQLATFSSVEQQVLTNDLLRDMGTLMSMTNISQLSGWVGMEVQAVMPAAYQGQPIEVAVDRLAAADSADLVVRDQAGSEVGRFAIAEGTRSMTWNGIDTNGNPVLYGTYSFTVENRAAGEIIDSRQAAVYARVQEAVIGADGPMLTTGTGVMVAAGDVLSLREPR